MGDASCAGARIRCGQGVTVAQRRLVVLWWSRTGSAQQAMQAAVNAAGDAEPALRIDVLRADQVLTAHDALQPDPQALQTMLGADGYLIVGSENLGSMAGMLKEAIDRLYYPLLGRIEGRPVAVIVAAGSDGQGMVRQLGRVAAGWRLREVMPALVIDTQAQTPQAIGSARPLSPAALADCAERGAALATGLQLGVF